MAWYDTFIGRKPVDLDEKLNPAQSYFDHKTDSRREFTFKYERAYEDSRSSKSRCKPHCR